MKKLFFLLIFLAALVGAAMLIVPSLVDQEGYKARFISSIEQSTDLKVEIKGGLTVAFTPLPEVQINDVVLSKQNTNFESEFAVIPSVTVNAELLPLLSGEVAIDAITMNNPVINLEVLSDGTRNWVFGKEGGGQLDIKKYHINYGIITFYDHASGFYKRIEQSNVQLTTDSITGPFAVEGDVRYNSTTYKFSAYVGDLTKESVDATWDVDNDIFTSKFNGTVTGDSSGTAIKALSGDFSFEGADATKLFQAYTDVGEDEIFSVADNSFVVKGRVDYADNKATIEKIEIASENILGEASLTMFFNDHIFTETTINLKYVNIDQLMGGGASSGGIFSNDIVLPSATVLADIYIDEFRYNREAIKNISLDAQLVGRAIGISSFAATLPGNAKLAMEGVLSKTPYAPESDAVLDDLNGQITLETIRYPHTIAKFIGTMQLYGNDFRKIVQWADIPLHFLTPDSLKRFNIRSSITAMPNIFELYDIKAIIDKSFISGGASIRYATSIPRIETDLKINELDLNEYLNQEAIGRKYAYQQNFNWVRRIGFDLSLETEVKKLMLNNNEIRDIASIFRLNPVKFAFERVRIHSKNLDFKGDFILDIDAFEPRILVDVDAQHINTNAFLVNGSAEKAKIEEDEAAAEAEVKLAEGDSRWSKENVNLRWLSNFSGTGNIRVKSLVHQGIKVDDFQMSGGMLKGEIDINDAKGKLFGGELSLRGTVRITELIVLGLSFGLTNIDLQQIMDALFGFSNLKGYISISGSIGTSGLNPYTWINKINGVFTVAARNVIVSGMDLHKMIGTLPKVPSDRMSAVVRDAMSGGTTEFYTVDGRFLLESGVLAVEKLEFASILSAGAMAGMINLPAWTMNIVNNYAFHLATEGVKKGTEEVTFSNKIVGSVDKPRMRYDTKAIERYIRERGY